MIYISPLLIAFLIYIIYEDKYILKYGILSLLFWLLTINEINNEIILLSILSILIYYYINLNNENTIYLLSSLFLIGSYLNITSTTLISLFISIEILSFCSLILINFYINDKYMGIIYYLFYGIFTSILILSLNYIYMGNIIGLSLLKIVFIFKLGLVPFHNIIPNIYKNISLTKILLIDIIYKLNIFYVIYKLNIEYNIWYIILLLLFSSIASVNYKNLLNIMIYSSILNYSMILIILNIKSDWILWNYVYYYSMYVVIFIYLLTNYFINKQYPKSYYLWFWLILLFNLLGIPPFSGFIIKYYVLYYVLLNKLYVLLIFSVLSFIIFSYTYIRIIITMLISDSEFIIYNDNIRYTNLLSILIIIISFPFILA